MIYCVRRSRISVCTPAAVLVAALCAAGSAFIAAPLLAAGQPDQQGVPHPGRCSGDNGGIALSPGFCATVFADQLGHARHLVVAQNGVVYVNTWSGAY